MAGAWQQMGGAGGTEVARPGEEEGMGGQGAKGVLAGTGGWEGWAGPPTIEKVTMSMKSMLRGTEGLGGWDGQSFICPHPNHVPCSELPHPSCTLALQCLLLSLLWAPRIPRPPSPRIASAPPVTALAHPASGLGPAGLPFSHHLLLTPCGTLALVPDLCELISQHSCPPPHPTPPPPPGGVPLGIRLSSRGQVG